MRTHTPFAVALCTFALAAPAAFAGPDWLEQGDAGPVLSAAQITRGVGQINSIAGSFSSAVGGGDFEDMYLIEITNPGTFSLSVSAPFDTQMFLFNVTKAGQAFGLLANQDRSDTSFDPSLTSISTDGTLAQITEPGVYAVAIALANRVPVSRTGPIFFFGSSEEISGADGPGDINPHEGWTGVALSGGSYEIEVIGTGFAEVPSPGAVAVLALSGLTLARRRR